MYFLNVYKNVKRNIPHDKYFFVSEIRFISYNEVHECIELVYTCRCWTLILTNKRTVLYVREREREWERQTGRERERVCKLTNYKYIYLHNLVPIKLTVQCNHKNNHKCIYTSTYYTSTYKSIQVVGNYLSCTTSYAIHCLPLDYMLIHRLKLLNFALPTCSQLIHSQTLIPGNIDFQRFEIELSEGIFYFIFLTE